MPRSPFSISPILLVASGFNPRRARFIFTFSFTLFVFLVLGAIPLQGQQFTDDSMLTGLPPFGSFHGSDFDSILLQNGNLHVQIPILSVLQRGGKTSTWRYIYDSPGWQAWWFPNPTQLDPNNGTYHVVPLNRVKRKTPVGDSQIQIAGQSVTRLEE